MGKHHGETIGGKRSTEFNIWLAMRERCLRPSCRAYPRYGGRGIGICEAWVESFPRFLADMGRRPTASHSIDRIDNDGPYSKENCRWATKTEQTRNRRMSRCAEYNGERRTIAEWADIHGLSYVTLRNRLGNGWRIARALESSVRHVPVYTKTQRHQLITKFRSSGLTWRGFCQREGLSTGALGKWLRDEKREIA